MGSRHDCRVALLRGINVGGARRLRMDELVALFETAGARSVRTYIQSGNVVFTASARASENIVLSVAAALTARFDGPVPVVLRTAAELAAAVDAMPFEGAEAQPRHFAVGFLDRQPTAKAVAALDPDHSAPDAFRVLGREVYLHYPHGSARSRLTADFLERALDVRCTARNWNTVRRLLAMTTR